MKDTYVLGISAFMSDSAACLLKNGRMIGAVEEERFVRRKHVGDFPVNAIKSVLDLAQITINEVDHVGFFFKPFLHLEKRFLQILKNMPASLSFLNTHGGPWMELVTVRKTMMKHFGLREEPYQFHFVEHHLAHIASSYYLSPFRESAVMSIDGSGELTSTLLGIMRGDTLTRFKEIYYPHSLGYLYAAVTKFLGFKPNRDEGKVMGLASYGKPKYLETFRDICVIGEEGDFRLNLDWFDFHRNAAYLGNQKQWVSQKFLAQFGTPRVPETEVTERDADIASSLQIRLHEVAMHLTQYLYRMAQNTNLCIAGGVGLNSVMNGRIFLDGPFKEIFIQPAAGDAGNAVGAALHTYHVLLKHPREIWDNEYIFLGPQFTDEQIQAELDKRLSTYVKCEPASTAAKLLTEGKILAWFQGRAEFGPRALGNRSIIADPRDPKMKDHLNRRVKHREGFRPFAPSVLEEKAGEYFESDYPSNVMLLVYDVLEHKRNVVPAITHVDGTGRVQSVSRRDNPLYYQLISEFYKLTGVPMILNTSFNVRGEPMVCTPAHALNCFYGTGIDNLVIGNYLVSK